MDPSYSLRQFQTLLDQLQSRDSYQALCTLALQHPRQASHFLDILDLRLMQTQTCPQNLFFLYAVDCLAKVLPEAYAPLLESRLCRLFSHVYRNSDPEATFQLVVLLKVWEGLKPALFAVSTLEALRDSLAVVNRPLEVLDSPDIEPDSANWPSKLPTEVTRQLGDESYTRLFTKLLDSQRKQEERELVRNRAALTPATEYEEGLAQYVDQMYCNPRQCRTCGARFSDVEEVKEHEITHVERGKRVAWLPNVEAWAGPPSFTPSTLPEEVICLLCGRPFPRNSNPSLTFPYLQALIVYSPSQQTHTLMHISCFQSNAN